MPRGDQRYPHHHYHGRDGYDEDWDDDVYYAAASGPGSGAGSRATGEEQRSNGVNGVEAPTGGRAERARAPTKRHYMKVPNLRQLRAMRPTVSSLPSGLLHHSDRQRSPRAGFDNDQGETATSSSGDGSSLALLGQLTPPSSPKEEWKGEQEDTSARESAACTQGGGVPSSPSTASPAGALSLGHGEGESPRQQFVADTPQEQVAEAAAASKPGNTCLVRLRGSPRSGHDSRPEVARSPSMGSPGRVRGFPALGGRETTVSPLATAASSGGGRGGGGESLTSSSVSGAKRPRTPTGVVQRFGATAWPKFRGEESPPSKSSINRRIPGGGVTWLGERGEKVGVESSRSGGLDSHKRGTMSASALSARQLGAKRIRQQGDKTQQRDDRGRGRPPSSGPSSCGSSSATPNSIDSSSGTPTANAASQFETNDSCGRHSPTRGRGGGDAAARQGSSTGGAAKGPSITDRPARWGAKGGVSIVRPPLGSPGGKPSRSSRSSGGSDTSNMLQKPPLLSKAAPGRGFRGRALRGALRVTGGEDDGEGRTFKASPRGSADQVCLLECFARAARAVYGPAKGTPVDAFVVQALSCIEGLDDGTPSLLLG